MYTLTVSADIAAKTAEMAWEHTFTKSSDRLEIKQSLTHYRKLVKRLTAICPPQETLVVMEATGTYWMPLAYFLHGHGFNVSVVNPAQPHFFAQMNLQRVKTDAIDAMMLVKFAQMTQPELWTPPPPVCDQLQQRLALRHDFLKTHTQECNRLHALKHNPRAKLKVIQRLQRHIDYLKQEIDDLKREIDHWLQSDSQWASLARHLLTIIGFGTITTAWTLVATHAFARCQNPDQATAFAGLAPYARNSGSSIRARRSVGRGGHAMLRESLYMAAASAARFNPPIKQFYDRLVERGKPKKVARIAAARKLLHIAWALVTKEQDFDPNYATIRQSQSFAA